MGHTIPRTDASSPALAAVSVAQMQRIDDAAIHTIGIPRVLLMNHAGQALARAVQTLRANRPGPILVCCGTGYNGGDGLSAAWHLFQQGCQPQVVLAGDALRLRDEPAVYARILSALSVPLLEAGSEDALTEIVPHMQRALVVVDALLGIGLQGDVRPFYARVIDLMNASRTPIVSADVPSGLDADTGRPHGVAVKATVTVAFGCAKRGFFLGDGPAHVGRVVVEDIGIPRTLLTST